MTDPTKAAEKLSGRRPSALVLAAGASTRFLGTKQLAEIGGKTLVERALGAVPSAEVNETVVVLGHQAKRVARAIGARKGVRVVVNPEYREGMGSSIRAGILALAKDAEGAMLLLADQPFVTRSLLRRMLKVYQSEDLSKIVAVVYGDLVTPPVIFPKRYFRELAALKADKGARSVIERHEGSLSLIRVRPRVVLADIDTREELEAARRLLEL
jgi:molybdenum cofactor cytidylyltransferase